MALDYRSEYQRYRRYYMYLGPIVKSPIFRAYFSVVASIFTIAIFAAFAIRPTIATIVSLQKQIEDKRALNTRLDEKINALSQLQNDYQAVEPDLPLVYAALPQKPDIPQAVAFIERTATASGVSLTSVTLSKADYTDQASVSGEAIASVSASQTDMGVTVTGNFDNIRNFLKQLVRLPRIFLPGESVVGTLPSGGGNLRNQDSLDLYYLP